MSQPATVLTDIGSEQFQAVVTRVITKLEAKNVVFGAEVLFNTVAEEMVLALWGKLAGWRKVEDGMPEPDQRVETFCPSAYYKIDIHRYMLSFGPGVGSWWIADGGGQNYPIEEGIITHWRPLPPEPRQDG